MEWYRYHPETLEYENPVTCQPNPARPGEFLIPPSATEQKPPTPKENEIPIFNPEKNTWTLKPDFRGKEYWLPDGTHHKIETIGEVLPENALYESPPPPPPTPEEEYNEMIRQRNKMLDDNDWTIIRHKDEVDLGMTPTLSPAAYQNTLVWRQQLRDMPESIKAGYKAGATPKWSWPTIPPELEEDFPDYPPKQV